MGPKEHVTGSHKKTLPRYNNTVRTVKRQLKTQFMVTFGRYTISFVLYFEHLVCISIIIDKFANTAL
jgi:hypothetical protein